MHFLRRIEENLRYNLSFISDIYLVKRGSDSNFAFMIIKMF